MIITIEEIIIGKTITDRQTIMTIITVMKVKMITIMEQFQTIK